MDRKTAQRLEAYYGYQARQRRNSIKGLWPAIAATAAAVTFFGFNAANSYLDEVNKSAEQAYEEDALNNSEKTVILNRRAVLNPGTNVRKYPAIVNPDENSEGNIEFQVSEGQRVVVDKPVTVTLASGDVWIAFTMSDREVDETDPVTLWVKDEVFDEPDGNGSTYARFEIVESFESGFADQVDVSHRGYLSADGQLVGIARFED